LQTILEFAKKLAQTCLKVNKLLTQSRKATKQIRIKDTVRFCIPCPFFVFFAALREKKGFSARIFFFRENPRAMLFLNPMEFSW